MTAAADWTQDDYAPFGARVTAFIVDSMIMSVVSLFVLFVIALANGGEIEFETVGTLLVWGATGVVWEALWVGGPARGKPGQRLAGFVVLRPDGSRVDLLGAVIRAVVRIASYWLFVVGFLLNAIMISATPRRQSLHDLVASTVCVRRGVVAAEEDTSVQHVPTAAQREHPVEAPRDSQETRHKGPFM